MAKVSSEFFTTEQQLPSRIDHEIADFWQQGQFSHFNGVNNVRINYAIFKQINNKKCIVISSGRTESYLKYQELNYDLFKQGYTVFLIDHRGQGLSQRLLTNSHKGYVENFQYYVDDLAHFIETIVRKNCLEKPYLLAHSMGGTIAARYLQQFPNPIKAAVLSSPMMGFNSGGIPAAIGSTLINITHQLNLWFDETPWYFFGHQNYTPIAFTDNKLMHSNIRYQLFTQLYQKMPELQLGGVTINWLVESLRALKQLFSDIDKIKTPTLVIQAGADIIVSNQAQIDFCQQLHQVMPESCPSGSPVVITDAHHELFFEIDKYRNKTLTTALNWFETH
ncbi:MAG: alpha/beta fold hydrolase [Colwellia sp.]